MSETTLTHEQIEALILAHEDEPAHERPLVTNKHFIEICRSALDREGARNEVLEEAAQAIEDWHEEPDDAWSERQIASGLAARIRALKREPNATAPASVIERSKAVRTCRKCKTSWEAPVNFCPQCGGVNDEMVVTGASGE
jgi:hypothetical protein